ncbi:MAG: Kdo hydroxylase family protein [Rhizomicrobium sp.]
MALDPIATLDVARWAGPYDDSTRTAAQDALESGKVLYFPKLPFVVGNSENVLLTDALSNGRAKNISRDPDGRIQGDAAAPGESALLSAMMARFAERARVAGAGPVPRLHGGDRAGPHLLSPGRDRRALLQPPRNDDKRLHVDAFRRGRSAGAHPAVVFANIHPMGGGSRLACRRAVRGRGPQVPVQGTPAAAAGALAVRKAGCHPRRRSAYDYLMLGLHDGAKLDAAYQRDAPQIAFGLPRRHELDVLHRPGDARGAARPVRAGADLPPAVEALAHPNARR